jgi:transglutaminase-like putative cysteine protease
MILQIEHQTLYRYREPVQFNAHRLLIRPLEGHDCQVRTSELSIEPANRVRWLNDVFGNSVALVEFSEPASRLSVLSRVTIEQFNVNPFDFVLETHAAKMPFTYGAQESTEVEPYCRPLFPQDAPAVREWIRPFHSPKGSTNTLDFLTAINRSVPLFFSYTPREEPGVQTPAQTLKTRSGSCRDFALLMMEAARLQGLATRFVSGYLCQNGTVPTQVADGATHAWMEVYLPGAGWKGFDPTCGILAADFHVRVAVTREPTQAVPVAGSYVGKPRDYLGMEVIVKASSLAQDP